MNYFIKNIIDTIISVFVENGIDWLITIIITYFTVRYATRQYYGKTKVIVSKSIMEQGLRALLRLNYNEELPETAKVIFVEYKGRCYKIKKKSTEIKDCNFFDKIRRTVAVVGGDTMGVSSYRPRDYGVLGVANSLGKPVLYNFQNGELYEYDCGNFIKLATEKTDNIYIYKISDKEKKPLSNVKTNRNIMIAIPIEYKKKLVGGLTFDFCTGTKTIYQNIDENDDDKIKKQKTEDNNKVIKEVKRTASNIINAYFKKKGEDF